MTQDIFQIFDADRRRQHGNLSLDQISLNLDEFQKSSAAPLTPRHIDLLSVVSCIAYADRAIPRQRGKRWLREIHLTIPVRELEVWSSARTASALYDCLYTATGDHWVIGFRQRGKISEHQLPMTDHRGRTRRATQILLFSGGMDSVAAAAALRDQSSGEIPFIPICIASNSHIASAAYSTSQELRPELIILHRKSPEPPQKEATYRTRSLVFMSAAAVMADLLKIKSIVIGENGQGALGPVLVPFGDEHPYVSNSPILAAAVRRLIAALWDHEFSFNFPFMFKTKSQVLSSVRNRVPDEQWSMSPSCSRHQRIKGRPPCGICGNCLLRRLSLQISGIPDRNVYSWQNLYASTLKQAEPKDASKSDHDIAICSIISMRELARVSDGSSSSRQRVQRLAQLLAQTTPNLEKIEEKVEALVKQHATEWSQFLTSAGKLSWLYKIGGGHEFT